MSLENCSDNQLNYISSLFWQEANLTCQFPCDIERAVLRVLPIGIIRLPRLSSEVVNLFISKQGLSVTLADFNSRLHGCLIAYKGKGLIIVDCMDSDAEMRFSVAHEAAHFILHYLIPRQRAINRLGADIQEVLDGIRLPTKLERIDSILSGFRIGVHSHLLTNMKLGLNDSYVESTEFSADHLALELLAPRKEIVRRLQLKSEPSRFKSRVKLITEILCDDFCLPLKVAISVAPLFEDTWTKLFSIEEWLK